jgi:hypothetical protein
MAGREWKQGAVCPENTFCLSWELETVEDAVKVE